METDEELQNRLITMISDGAWYSAEDIGDARGNDMDNIAEEVYHTSRMRVPGRQA
jgi:hypothetical protein